MLRKSFNFSLLAGFLFSNLLALFIIGLTGYFFTNRDGVMIYSEFVILPLLMGMINSWFWKSLKLSSKAVVGYSCLSGLTAILLSFVFLREGFICLIIVSPLVFCFIIIGAFIGRMILKKQSQKLNVSVFSLMVVLFITDAVQEHHYEHMVADEIIIKASPQEIWRNVVSFEPIQHRNSYWLFNIGMPSPAATTVTGYYKGAGRKCIFSNGYIFDEKIVTYNVNRNLTFDIIGQPKDPEIMGHIDILKGQFILKDNGNGTTTLIGNSWYKLHVFPTWYYDMWAESITRNVHLRVMEHIKELSETR
ncbi:hypothetical protein AY601_1932 [Pedobacter cryoconitis]|uniref:Polyketide cyclase/dehydrase/lipid transport protein n=1 Tax=Pedobacter cryoconitis TaxID=188932 RepID=A0A127VC90_9SPHI|nr:hypothetical protein [Pedobacter cryoconitis]AMP98839.1 hypothetical protein AY601_1932 [Pedobacter cryoconitis]